MKTAGKVLGISGGVIAVICSIVLIVAMAASSAAISNGAVQKAINEAMRQIDPNAHTFFDDFPGLSQHDLAEIIRVGIIAGFSAVTALAAIALVGGALGIAGGIVADRKPYLAGVLSIISALFSFIYIVTAVLTGLAAIFTFANLKRLEFAVPAASAYTGEE